jgi:hypothetical protein
MKTHFTRIIRRLPLWLSLLCAASVSTHAQTLDWHSIAPAATSTGGTFSLSGILESDGSPTTTSGGTYSLDAGFWSVNAVQTPGAPLLTVNTTTTNTVVVSWSAAAADFVLQQSSSLNTPSWSTAPQAVNSSGGFQFVVVNPPTGTRFYRLNKTITSGGFQVINLNDAGAGSLRAAIQLATNNALVDFAPGLEGAIVLTSELAINKSLTISGPGATVLAVSGGNTSRVFNITSGSVSISGLAIRDGVAPTANAKGGGVFNSTSLVLSNCALVSNLALGGNGANGVTTIGGAGGSGFGGGIYSTGTLVVVNCTLALNEARGGNGGNGGVSANGDFGLNAGAGGSGLGGAICNDGILNMTNCTFASNRVNGGNGGIGGDGGLSIGRGGNGGGAEGAGVLNRLTCQSANVTITGGFAERGNIGTGSPNGTPGSTLGGGLRSTTANAFLVNSLIAENSLGSGGAAANGPDVSGTVVSQGYNLVGMTNGSSAWVASDKVGDVVSPVDPWLDVLQDNGGSVPTMGLLSSSPAIDKGKNIGLSTDQRGLPRPIDFAGVPNAAGGNGSDIGAFEVNP